jgi:hypothetical protein
MKLLLTFFSFLCLLDVDAQSFSLKIGVNYNTTIQKQIPEIRGTSLLGFDPKYGYQAALSYKQPLLKSIFVAADIGYLNKGHQRISPSTNKNLGDVNYNYLSFVPSIGYDLPFGFFAKLGISFNHLLNYDGSTIGEIQKKDYAFLATLAYNYKRIGLEFGYNKSFQSIQKVDILGLVFNHYHKWLTFSLSYTFYTKK